MAMMDFEQIEVTSEAELWDWLGVHHARDQSVWLVTWKAAHRDKYVSRDAVLDALIAHGWIDGRRKVLDADRTMQLISPRRQQAWSQSYKDRVAKLKTEGRMHPAGQAMVAEGRASGLWDFFADVDAMIAPDDLLEALTPMARAHFDAYPDGYTRNVLRWIKLAKTPATRAKRVAEVARVAAENGRIPQM